MRRVSETTSGPELSSYDTIVVAFSGGKDSLACLLHLLELGVPASKIELWHHDIDGREGSDLMDWAPTRDYCRKLAAAFGLPILFSWREGGFEREMLRNESRTARVCWEEPDGSVSYQKALPVSAKSMARLEAARVEEAAALAALPALPRNEVLNAGARLGTYQRALASLPYPAAARYCAAVAELKAARRASGVNTRRKFPQVVANLQQRWCSGYLKVDVCRRILCGSPRFTGQRTLIVTGERAEESAARAKYLTFEPHVSDLRDGKRYQRHIDHWRPVHDWEEAQVWELIRRHRVRPHPAYQAGFGRVSCQFCIFGSPDQWASARAISPERFERVASYETEFGVTIQRAETIKRRADRGTTYDMTAAQLAACQAESFEQTILVPETEGWELPAGAFGDSCGPT